jgi:hypothetical protein
MFIRLQGGAVTLAAKVLTCPSKWCVTHTVPFSSVTGFFCSHTTWEQGVSL